MSRSSSSRAHPALAGVLQRLGVLGVLLLACGGPAEYIPGPPTSHYVPWGRKGAPAPTLDEPDHDGDGLVNAVDRCPDLPEDADGFRDDDGCPDPDNDGDGIPDAKDPGGSHP